MQSLDVISVNIWQMLASLANLVLLFLMVKKFLYKPVKAMLEERRRQIDGQYASAAAAQEQADGNRALWEEKLAGADAQADAILKEATENAKMRGDRLIAEAKDRADGIIRNAENEAELERKRSTDGIKREIVEVSEALAEKMLEREINRDDHRMLIDSFIEKIGEEND